MKLFNKMLKLFNGTTHQVFGKDVYHFATCLNIPSRSKMPFHELMKKVQESIILDENVSKIAEEYLTQNASEKLKNKTLGKIKAKQTRKDAPTSRSVIFRRKIL